MLPLALSRTVSRQTRDLIARIDLHLDGKARPKPWLLGQAFDRRQRPGDLPHRRARSREQPRITQGNSIERFAVEARLGCAFRRLLGASNYRAEELLHNVKPSGRLDPAQQIE